MRYAIKVIWQNGEEEYLREGAGPDGMVAAFADRNAAICAAGLHVHWIG
jgi:hypothetical protein